MATSPAAFAIDAGIVTMMNPLMLAVALAATPVESATPADLAWLAGCWEYESKNSRYEEIWLAPVTDGMPGLSRRVGHDGRTREFEFLRIAPGDKGGLDYVAQPSGNPPVRFALQSLQGTRAVFVNPLHDFPQSISYEFRPPDELHARIEGARKSIDFPMQRKACESTP